MPQLTREIKRRIKSVGSTRKITKAMELVSAAKMRKAVNNVLLSRPYANLSWQTALNLAARTESKYHPLLVKRPVKKAGLIVITSNRGLCGSFNHNLLDLAVKFIENREKSGPVELELIILGKKARDFLARRKNKILADFPKLDVTSKIEEVRGVSRLAMTEYLNNNFDEIDVVYTDYISSLHQKARVFKILPLDIHQEDQYLGETKKTKAENNEEEIKKLEYLFEPNPDAVLDEILPRLIEVKIYQAILESDASEHSSRMIAMQNASSSASDMIDSLTLAFNQARQSGITSELADISGGAAALE